MNKEDVTKPMAKMPGFNAEGALYKTTGHYQSMATQVLSYQGNRIISQATRSSALALRNKIGVGTVNCSSECIAWGPCGYDPEGRTCCQNYHEECYWWPY